MQNYNDLKLNEAQFLSVVGVKLQQFNILVQFFEPCWEAYISVYTVSGDYRRRIKRQRKDGVFPEIETRLIFILSYMKNNPLQQAHAAAFNMNQPQANQWIHLLKNVLNTPLEKANCIPCRTVDALNKLLVEGQDVLIDGTERPILRPSDPDVQKEFYSGKKNHTIKNLIVRDLNNTILYLSQTWEGKMHDKMMCDIEELEFSKKVRLWLDSGFEGFNPENAEINRPKKKPKGKDLTDIEKKSNQQISRTRVKVEHAIGNCKIFRIVKEEIRSFIDDFRDVVMVLACALSNFKLKYK